MKIVSVILARGGSKGIPRKNLIDLNGNPLISYAINASLNSNVDETWVSSEDDEIIEVSKQYGARTLRRPAELAEDESTSESALSHFADNVKSDYTVFIQPTSPLLLAEDINKGIELLSKYGYDSVFSAYEEHWTGRWKLNPRDEYRGILRPSNYTLDNRPRRQDLLYTTYIENGAFYISSTSTMQFSCRLNGHIGILKMPQYRSFQVDTMEDLELIKKILK